MKTTPGKSAFSAIQTRNDFVMLVLTLTDLFHGHSTRLYININGFFKFYYLSMRYHCLIKKNKNQHWQVDVVKEE